MSESVTNSAGPVAAGTAPLAATGHEVRKYDFINALRGYAILLVIMCHSGYAILNLPYPVKKVTSAGWHGVQLFFLVSCVTLMMSWRSDERKNIASPLAFWTRRFFRIVPMYYLGAGFYFWADPPASGFHLKQLLASFFFINSWHPVLMPTVAGQWSVVPGGWSVGDEFTFYFLFPLMVLAVRNLRAAGIFLAVSIFAACVANTLGYNALFPSYGNPATANFIYFWLFNQLPVFALGTILYFTINRLRDSQGGAATAIRQWSWLLLPLCALLFVAIAEIPVLPQYFAIRPLHLLPNLMAMALLFAALSLVLALKPKNIVVNAPVCAMGEVSFSAYILHFFVIQSLEKALPVLTVESKGVAAIAAFLCFMSLVVLCTFIASKITYEAIEKPMIRLGARVANLVRLRNDARPAIEKSAA
ncbi:MAG TPA: acyltransferase [Rhizomicrobium sp.]|nr:acyltransferase [Rhizomicrobium sp.]